MKPYEKSIAVTACLFAFPLLVLAQSSAMRNGQDPNGTNDPHAVSAPYTSQYEAGQMVPANAALLTTVDAKDMHEGSTFKAKLNKTVVLDNKTKLPSGTILIGQVTNDDMQVQGVSKIALRITQAQLKNGKVIPLKATIVGMAPPESADNEGYSEVPNNWTAGTLRVDQLGVIKGVDLHSRINSENSGVFVSTKKDNVKLDKGSELELAISQHGSNSSSMASNSGS